MHTRDIHNFIRKLTWRKSINAAKVIASFYYSKWPGRPQQWGLPFNVSIEPTTSCNLGCPECPSGLKQFSRPTGKMDVATYQKIIDELGDTLCYLYFYFQGEPYLHPQFLQLVQAAHTKGIYSVTSTNAHFLSERKAAETVASGLDRIIISLDGSTQEVYEQYRVGGHMEKVLEGTRRLVAAKQAANSHTPHIVLQCLVVRPNEHQLDDIQQLGDDLGVDEVAFKTAQIYDYEDGHELIPTLDRFARYAQKTDGKWQLKNKLLNHCWKLWHACVFTWDGQVVPCCFDKDASHSMGNIHEEEFQAIWHNSRYQQFRQQLFQSRSSIDICTNCSEGTKVWFES